MTVRRVALVGAALVAAANAAAQPRAAATSDAGWPCETEPTPSLAPARYWAEADRADARAWRDDAALAALVAEVAPRSVSQEAAVARLRQAARSYAPAQRAKIAAGLIETIDAERATIIAGIRRFNTRQAAIARRIEASYAELDTPATPSAAEKRAITEDQAQWDVRIFEDRQRMLPIICRQPGALETRLTALIGALRADAR